MHWKETEWVSFFTVKTIPFLSNSFVVCSFCKESVLLTNSQAQLLKDEKRHLQLIAFLEEHQLSKKTAVQRSFLLSQRAQRDSDL